jgi:hypothetical protein
MAGRSLVALPSKGKCTPTEGLAGRLNHLLNSKFVGFYYEYVIAEQDFFIAMGIRQAEA